MQFSMPATQHDMHTQDEQIPRRKTSNFSLICYLCNCWSGMITVSGLPESKADQRQNCEAHEFVSVYLEFISTSPFPTILISFNEIVKKNRLLESHFLGLIPTLPFKICVV